MYNFKGIANGDSNVLMYLGQVFDNGLIIIGKPCVQKLKLSSVLYLVLICQRHDLSIY